MTKLELAYLAGVLDSDGTIGIKRNTYSMRVVGDSEAPTYSERIHVRQVERAALELFSNVFGGSIGTTKAYAKNGRSLFNWGLTDKRAALALKALLPYLRIKRRQAENCLQLRIVKEESKKARIAKGRGHVGAARRPDIFSRAMEDLYAWAKALNKVGV